MNKFIATAISLRQIEAFIKKKNELRRKLCSDLKEFHIIKEADLQSCVYFHLRKFLVDDPNWRVYCEKYSPQTEHFVDILIFQKDRNNHESIFKPRIAIELKRNRKRIDGKDRKSLGKALVKLKVNKVYFLTINNSEMKYQRIPKRNDEKNKLFELVGILSLKDIDKKRWNRERNRIKKLMDISQRKTN